MIPAFNEERTIGAVVGAGRHYGAVIVVDDGSTDDTQRTALEAGATVIRLSTNRGYDAALRSGLQAAVEAGFDAALTLDGDGQHEISAVGLMVDHLDEGAHIVLGARTAPPRLAERAFNRYGKWRFGVPDLLCGMKAYRQDLIREHGPAMAGNTIGTGLALKALRDGVPSAVVDVQIHNRRDPARFGSGLRPNLRILAALLRALRDDLLRR